MEICENVCRTCLKTSLQLSSLNVKFENEVQGKKMLQFILGTKQLDREDFSQICGECMKNLSVSYHFKKQCLVSEERIKEHIETSDPLFDPQVVTTFEVIELTTLKKEQACETFVQEALEEANVTTADAQPSAKSKYRTFKIEEDEAKNLEADAGSLTESYRKPSCTKCNLIFADKTSYRRHYQMEHLEKGKSITCKKCQITFPNAMAYGRHYRDLHHMYVKKMCKVLEGAVEKEAGTASNKSKTCLRCNITFNSIPEYNKHYRTIHGKQSVNRTMGRPKKNELEITIGCSEMEPTDPTTKDSKKPRNSNGTETVVCDECGKTVKAFRLRDHKASHKGKSLTCSICGTGFILKSYLIRHMQQIHLKQKRYICKYCGEGFIHWVTRKYHIHNIHEPDKKEVFPCHICGGNFTQKSSLTTHMQVHTRNFKHECTFCIKRFISADSLKRHLVSHTGEKNVICPVCGKAFGTKRYLTQHMVTHTKERNYECDVCSKTFTQCHVLRSHIRATHPDQPLPPPGTVLKKTLRTYVAATDEVHSQANEFELDLP